MLEEYKEIYRQNKEIVLNNRWFKPAALVAIIAILAMFGTYLYIAIYSNKLEKEGAEIKELEEELKEED